MLLFQVAYRCLDRGAVDLELSVSLAELVIVRRIDLSHVAHSTYSVPAAPIIPRGQGFYPDPLVPDPDYRIFPNQTRGI